SGVFASNLLRTGWLASILGTAICLSRSRLPLRTDRCRRIIALTFLSLAVVLFSGSGAGQGRNSAPNSSQGIQPIRAYIAQGWDQLSRSLSDCATYSDPKLTGPPQLYLPYGFSEPDAVRQLETRCRVEVKTLPASGDRLGKPGVQTIDPPG